MTSSIIKRVAIAAAVVGTAAGGSLKRLLTGLKPPIRRTTFLANVPRDQKVLEIGPFDCPQMVGQNAFYFDVLDQKDLQKRAVLEGRDPDGCPEIHFVSANGDLGAVSGTFDVVFSSHVIEHQHDLIKHLVAVSAILRPGGSYYLIVPDKRFCFDHFIPASTIDNVLAVHRGGEADHIEKAISHAHFDLAHNDPLKHWLGQHGAKLYDPHAAQEVYERSISNYRAGQYRDVHAWQFTPQSFRSIVGALSENGLTPFNAFEVHDTRFANLEFYAVLTRL